jgi:ComF family protein
VPPQGGTLCTCCGEELGIASFTTPLLAKDDPRRQADLLCQPCRLVAPAFVKAVAYGVYQGPLRSLIHLLKYKGMRPIAYRLGGLLAETLDCLVGAGANSDPSPMLVVPVPLHAAKRRTRGYNHAMLLAQALVREASRRQLPWELQLAPHMLERRRATASQAGLTPRQRRQNLRGAFFVPRASQLAGRQILLIDDVYTTGATARACSRVLMNAGAASVRVATVARAQREGWTFWDAHFIPGVAKRREEAQAISQAEGLGLQEG